MAWKWLGVSGFGGFRGVGVWGFIGVQGNGGLGVWGFRGLGFGV